jgi:GT2 family glycosyltransferase
LGAHSFEVFVVDNASGDGTCDAVRQRFPNAHLIENETNRGFAAANNQAIGKARGEYLILVNSDVLLLPGAMEKVLDFMDRNQDVGIASPLLINEKGQERVTDDPIPTLLTESFFRGKVRRVRRRLFPSKAPDVPSVRGACMLARASAVKNVGMLDERYFFYLEETDWCLRMQERGLRICLVRDARAKHLFGRTVNKMGKARGRIEYARSLLAFIKKHHGQLYYLAFRCSYFGKLCLKLFILSALNLVTLGAIPLLEERFSLDATLWEWQMRLCPASWGLKRDS